ncbi:MAG TPA: creatininase family protein, partial [Burkholderiaceae bacterium]|nr:creatininase family protein [Burkholderiaceae bacterium]
AWAACASAATPSNAPPAGYAPIDIEAMTSTELHERIAHGTTTVLVPIGGTEQNGAHMVLGKHNVRAHVLADRIAQALGDAVVAPVVAYVPEGSIHPPAAHMKYTGTISIPDAVFEGLLEATARSFKQHGFHDIVFLGDHGGYQADLARVAAKLDREWAADPSCRVHAPAEYYRVTQTAYVDALKAHGAKADEIGVHAGLADTSLALAVDPALVRAAALSAPPVPGVTGDPRRATAALGELGVTLVVNRTVEAIRADTKKR